jgi:hypothetical protein
MRADVGATGMLMGWLPLRRVCVRGSRGPGSHPFQAGRVIRTAKAARHHVAYDYWHE